MKNSEQVDASKCRIWKEQFYFGMVVVASVFGWIWIFYSAFKDFKSPIGNFGYPSPTPSYYNLTPTPWQASSGCLIKSLASGGYESITKIGASRLYPDEPCLTVEDIGEDECFVRKDGGGYEKRLISGLYDGEFCFIGSGLPEEEVRLAREEYEEKLVWSREVPPQLEPEKESIPSISEVNKVSEILAKISTPVFLIIGFFLSLFLHLVAMAYIRINGVRVGPNQFPELYEGLVLLSGRLGMKKMPDMFVVQADGILNAFATRLVFRKILVVYSSLAEALIEKGDRKELEAVCAHELGHHALGHTHVLQWFLFPGMLIPMISTALSRAREYSCDRVMRALIPEREVCERALIKLAAGRMLGKRANVDAYVGQISQESGFFTWIAELWASHPHLPKRIAALARE